MWYGHPYVLASQTNLLEQVMALWRLRWLPWTFSNISKLKYWALWKPISPCYWGRMKKDLECKPFSLPWKKISLPPRNNREVTVSHALNSKIISTSWCKIINMGYPYCRIKKVAKHLWLLAPGIRKNILNGPGRIQLEPIISKKMVVRQLGKVNRYFCSFWLNIR